VKEKKGHEGKTNKEAEGFIRLGKGLKEKLKTLNHREKGKRRFDGRGGTQKIGTHGGSIPLRYTRVPTQQAVPH